MKKRRFLLLIIGLALLVAALPLGLDPADAGPGTSATDAAATPSGGTFFANSPIIRKFVDSLPGLGPANANNLGQYIPVATPGTLPGLAGDYYEIGLVEYREQMHSDLPPVVGAKTSPTATGGTKLRGYVQENSGVAVGDPHYLGPLIIANRDTPVRIKFTNRLATGAAGNLFIPMDPRYMGAGMGPLDSLGATCDPSAIGANCASFTENRATLHLHGGRTPWISDGTPHQWTVPAGETTPFLKGASAQDVPDMTASGDGDLTFFWTNQQSARVLFYHDHAYGITRLNVYAGEAAGYIIRDAAENSLISAGRIPSGAAEVPLIIQDRTFVPQDIAVQDAKWDTTKWGKYGDLWFPHVYETNQWIGNPDGSGTNPFGRWDYGPWFWPIYPVVSANAGIYTAADSGVPESFMDTPIVNGTAYPYLNVDRKAYRFRILNACNDRMLNLQIYLADPADVNGTEVKMVAANAFTQGELATDFGQGTELYNSGSWTKVDSRTIQAVTFSSGNHTLYANLGIDGLWQFDGTNWAQISNLQPALMAASTNRLYAQFAGAGVWQWDGLRLVQISTAKASKMVTSGTNLYVDFSPWGLWWWNGASWTQISPAAVTNMATTDSLLYVDLSPWGLWKWNGASWTMINSSSPGLMVASGTNLYAEYGVQGLWQWNGSTWTQISPASVSKMVASASALYVDLSPWGLWQWNGASWARISDGSPTDMVASSTNLYTNYGIWGLWKFVPGTGFTQIASAQPSKMQPVSFAAAPNWPTDGRAGGVPDPKTAGPKMILIGSEGGFLPTPTVLDNTPINYEYNRRSATVLNVSTHTLYLGPAERADVIIDFSQVPAGSKLILYNDAPAPNPGYDTRFDYYTGDPDQTSSGGAPATLAGYGPNTRTILQFRVSSAAPAAAFDLAALQAAWPAAYAASQPGPLVAESAYNTALGTTYVDNYAPLFAGSNTQHTFDFVAGRTFTYVPDILDPLYPGPVTVTPGQTAKIPVKNKAIQELFDDYGRMNATLATEMPFTSVLIQNSMPWKYIDPATEVFSPGEVQIWKVTHNGVDTHAIHFHLFDVQVINRVGWDGTIKPPWPYELGWKDTVKMNPLEDIIVAVHAPSLTDLTVPFAVPSSNRLLDVTMPAGTTAQFTNIDPATGQPPAVAVSNQLTDFHWEYVWHCHLLGHEENDMMRPMIYNR